MLLKFWLIPGESFRNSDSGNWLHDVWGFACHSRFFVVVCCKAHGATNEKSTLSIAFALHWAIQALSWKRKCASFSSPKVPCSNLSLRKRNGCSVWQMWTNQVQRSFPEIKAYFMWVIVCEDTGGRRRRGTGYKSKVVRISIALRIHICWLWHVL